MKRFVLMAAFAAVLTAGCAKKAVEQPKTLVISTWGYNEDLLWETIFTPFEESSGISVELDTGGTSDRFTRLLNSTDSDVDVFMTAQSYAQRAISEDLFDPFDASRLKAFSSLYEEARAPNGSGYGAAYTVNRLRIAVNPQALPPAVSIDDISSWEDLYNPALSDQLTVPSITTTFGPAMIYIGSQHQGVSSPAQDGGQAGLDGIEALKNNILKSYTRSSEVVTLLQNEEVSVALVADYAYKGLVDAVPGIMFIDPAEGSFVNFNTVNIVKGSQNQDAAYAFIDFLLSEETQQRVADVSLDSPVNTGVKLTEEAAMGLTDLSVLNNVSPFDSALVHDNLEMWTNRWNEILLAE